MIPRRPATLALIGGAVLVTALAGWGLGRWTDPLGAGDEAARGYTSRPVPLTPPPAGRVPIPCDLDLAEPLHGAVDFWQLYPPDADGPRGMVHALAQIEDRRVWITPVQPSGTGTLDLPGQARVSVDWGGAEDPAEAWCRQWGDSPEAGMVAVRGVVDSPGAAVRVEGCGARSAVRADGSFELQIRGLPCWVRAVRTAGAFEMPGPAVLVRDDHEVHLEVPDFVPAGIGVRVSATRGGVEVREVHPGMPAAEAGLRVGDLVVAVDEHPTAGWDGWEFRDRVVGPAETVVRLTVQANDGPREVLVERRPLESWGSSDQPIR